MFFTNKKVLVTGGSGMIGRSLVKLLLDQNAIVTVADLNKPNDFWTEVNFIKVDLRYLDQCENICNGIDYVFHVAGIKGSPKMCAEQPADFMVPMLQFNTNMAEAARKANVKWYLYTSSVGVYSPADVFFENDVWKTMPSENDKFAGWTKRMGELQLEAYQIQYGIKNSSIVRPANVYGNYDNFNPLNAMVIPSLIRKAQENDVLEVWGDGSPIRDFIHADDVAYGMLFAIENQITDPINLGSGKGHAIKEIVDLVVKYSNKENLKINWLTDKPSGDKVRILNMERANSEGFYPKVSLDNGVRKTTEWFIKNKSVIDNRFNAFTKNKI